MIAPCKTRCMKDSRCRGISTCDAWKMFKRELELEREGKLMKCPKCHRDMIRKQSYPGVYYFECTNCHHAVGKPKEKDDETKNE